MPIREKEHHKERCDDPSPLAVFQDDREYKEKDSGPAKRSREQEGYLVVSSEPSSVVRKEEKNRKSREEKRMYDKLPAHSFCMR